MFVAVSSVILCNSPFCFFISAPPSTSTFFPYTTLFRSFNHLFTPGDRFGIIGPNGSGKTTLLNIMAKRLCPDQGDVEVGETRSEEHTSELQSRGHLVCRLLLVNKKQK